ncbi:hypothetical protein ACGGZK_08295 [Agromyces sp. MMS24-K17]|uniref:hypothetical protein n=1 Tax=Agromyces sp. MMS24-K17 TaxID=3372850 RepID=UPI003754832D
MSNTTSGSDGDRRDEDVPGADVDPSAAREPEQPAVESEHEATPEPVVGEPAAVEQPAVVEEPVTVDEPVAEEHVDDYVPGAPYGDEPAAAADASPEAAASPAPPASPEASGAPEASVPPAGEPVAVGDDEAERAAEQARTAELDAAVARASVAYPDPIDETHEPPSEPVAADSVRRETYVPPAAGAAAVGAATLAPPPAAPVPPQTVYVQAPAAPKSKGNRGFGVLVALIGTVVFAALYAGVAYLLLLGNAGSDAASTGIEQFLVRAVFWLPILGFFIGFALLAAIVNRNGYWAYAVFAIVVAAITYFAYIAGALLTVQAWTLTFDQAQEFIASRWLDPFAVTGAAIASQVPIWLGGWIAARGRQVTARNREALEAYDRELAAGPKPYAG